MLTYAVTLEHEGTRYRYTITVDEESAARAAAVVDARVRAAADNPPILPYEFHLWTVQEVQP